MDFVSSARAAENRTKRKETIAVIYLPRLSESRLKKGTAQGKSAMVP